MIIDVLSRVPPARGDLLLAPAIGPGGLVARTLGATGVDPAALAAAVAPARDQPTPAGLVRLAELDRDQAVHTEAGDPSMLCRAP